LLFNNQPFKHARQLTKSYFKEASSTRKETRGIV